MTAGTASPSSASHATAGRTYSRSSTGTGKKTSSPTANAVPARRRSIGAPATVQPPMYAAVSSGEATQIAMVWKTIECPVSTTSSPAIGSPSAIVRQNLSR